jgi:hypothetical protein
MLVYGHYGDGDGEEVMLASIVVVVVKGGMGTGAWPSLWGYSWLPSVKT